VADPLDEQFSPDHWVRLKATQLLWEHHDGSARTQPWFMQVNFLGPHPPFIVKPSQQQHMQDLQGRLPEAVDADVRDILVFEDGRPKMVPYPMEDSVNITLSRLQYATLLHQIDGEIQEILDAVAEMGAMDNTIIALTSDHGEHLGDHLQFGKTSPFESAAHVPMFLAGTPLPVKGQEVHHPVSLIDIPMTFLELAGAVAAPTMEGYSLLPALTGNPEGLARPAVMFGMNHWEVPYEGAGYSPGIVQFDAVGALFGDSFLKLICCPHGCRKGGSLLPLPIGEPQVALMNVTAGTGPQRFEHNILNQPPGRGIAEALHLASFLADDFRDVCLPLLQSNGAA